MLRYYLRDCRKCPEEERRALLKTLAEEKARSGPSKSTHSETAAAKSSCIATSTSSKWNTTGRLNAQSLENSPSSFPVTVADGNETMTARCGADDGSGETIVSSSFAERVILKGIGKMKK